MNDGNLSLPTPPTPLRLPHVPRLSILFLLVWMTAAAAVLAVYTRWLGADRTDALNVVISLLLPAAFGWVIAGGLLILWHAARHTLWPLEPGE